MTKNKIIRNELRNKGGNLSFSKISHGSFVFRWGVADGGYVLNSSLEIAPGLVEPPAWDDKQPPWLIPKGEGAWQYGPLSNHTLHREFAKLNGEGEAILRFANKYGLMGQFDVLLVPPTGGISVLGESLERWSKEAIDMGVILAIWDAVNLESRENLEQIIRWSDKGDDVGIETWWELRNGHYIFFPGRRYQSLKEFNDCRPSGATRTGGTFALLAGHNPEYQSDLLKHWRLKDVIGPALYYVCREVNKRLRQHVHPQVLPFRKNDVFLVPDSLLAAMWLLCMWEISGETKLILCLGCRLWAEQEHGRQRYCSDACKQLAYRERKKKSLETLDTRNG